jgi:hypothetical protein
MRPVIVYVNGGRFELAPTYTADDVIRELSSPRGDLLRFDLRGGGAVSFGITPGLAWAVEEVQ